MLVLWMCQAGETYGVGPRSICRFPLGASLLILFLVAQAGCIERRSDHWSQVVDARGEDGYQVQPAEIVSPADGDVIAAEIPDARPDLCVPDCSGEECGDDGCGGTCGLCEGNQECTEEGLCTCPEKQQCFGQCCKKGLVCKHALGECCEPVCEGKVCGPDGCGHQCGGCAGNLDCNEAQSGCVCFNELCNGVCCDDDEVCHKNQCCVPDCYGKVCGDNGCGVNCGDCAVGQICEGNKCVAVSNGTCNNGADLAIIAANEDGISDAAKTCAMNCLGESDVVGCGAPCVEDATGLSEQCSACYVGVIACSIGNCLGECVADPYAEECLQCMEDMGCYSDFHSCSGL